MGTRSILCRCSGKNPVLIASSSKTKTVIELIPTSQHHCGVTVNLYPQGWCPFNATQPSSRARKCFTFMIHWLCMCRYHTSNGNARNIAVALLRRYQCPQSPQCWIGVCPRACSQRVWIVCFAITCIYQSLSMKRVTGCESRNRCTQITLFFEMHCNGAPVAIMRARCMVELKKEWNKKQIK